MTEQLCYSALDLAAIVDSMKLGCRDQAEFLNRVWEGERSRLLPRYRENKRQMLLDVAYWLTYLSDKPAIDAEFPIVQSEARAAGSELMSGAYTADTPGVDLFFKSARLRILYGAGKPYVRVKRRTLLRKYGYKRLSRALVARFRQCLQFYHLQTFVRDNVECAIEDVGIDEMIVFRVAAE